MQAKGIIQLGVDKPLGLSALPLRVYHTRKTRRTNPCVLATLSSSAATPVAVRIFEKGVASWASKLGLPAVALHLAAATPFLHNPAILFQHAAGQQNAALLTTASLMTFAFSMGGLVYYGARSAWQRIEPWITRTSFSPEPESLYGIEVTGSRFLNRPSVQRAIEFAETAHRGQFRKTQEPYVAHCVATAAIVEGLLAPTEDDARAEAAVITALLHDVIDDAGVDLDEIRSEFGPQVATMVSKVSQLSATNQLVRRRLRLNDAEPTPQEAAQLRHMILTMVSEPLVIVVKLADRLHNMRTVYALPPEKQKAVAEETRRVWCSLAERLGIFSLKSELEDLSFAVLQPEEYRALRAELDLMWGLCSIAPTAMTPSGGSWDAAEPSSSSSSSVMQLDVKSGGGPGCLGAAHAMLPTTTTATTTTSIHPLQPHHQAEQEEIEEVEVEEEEDDDPEAAFLTAEQLEVRGLVRSVLPFDASTFNMDRLNIPPSARRGLEVLQGCARALLQEITTEGVAAGLEVSVQGRVKSLFSTFKKMARKGVPLTQVYDARALRVVVEDSNGVREREAISACYKLLPAVHRLWKKVEGEDDDYISAPKESGYQSLHTAVVGPGGIPMEVQIRSSSMHEVAEYGRAAHWAYKESIPGDLPGGGLGGGAPTPREDITVGHPVLQISPGGRLRDGVVVDSEAEGRRLCVAVSLLPRKFESPHTTKASPLEYSTVLEYVAGKGYFSAGQGDLSVSLELYTLCSDGKYHKLDRFGQKLSAVAVPLSMEALQQDAEAVLNTDTIESASAGFAAAPSSPPPLEREEHEEDCDEDEKHEEDIIAAGRRTTGATTIGAPPSRPPSMDEAVYMSNRIRLLRSMLEWGADIGSELPESVKKQQEEHAAVEYQHQIDLAFETAPIDVMVLVWPSGQILRVPRGTSAGAVARREGGGGARRRSTVVNVNNRFVSEKTPLQDGDYLVLTQEAVKV